MRMPGALHRVAILLVLAGTSLSAQSYRGVQVGQRDDLLPLEFSQVKRGELDAQFGNERMQVFVNGALVTGFKVVPLAPLTLAEAVAKHGSIGNVSRMLTILDGYGEPLGFSDPVRRIAYLSASLSPDSVISSVTYYDTNASMLLWLGDVDPAVLTVLQTAARNVSLAEVNSRPRTGTPAAAARFLVDQAIKTAQNEAQQFSELIKGYAQLCSSTAQCREQRTRHLEQMQEAARRFESRLTRAEVSYAANAQLFNYLRPAALDDLQHTLKDLTSQVREIASQQTKQPQRGNSPPD